MSEKISNKNDNDSLQSTLLSSKENNIKINNKQLEKIISNSYILKPKMRWIIFFLFTNLNLLMNFDHGTIPAATEQLRDYLDLSDSKLGLFGSLVFLGTIIGSLISLTIINKFNRKFILMVFLILCGLSLFLFTKTTNYIFLCIDRIIIGLFQAFISIYLPLWCEQFGTEKRKSLMIALLQVASPLGVLVGYIVTTLLNMHLTWLPFVGDIADNEKWLYSFYIQSFIVWGLSLCLLFFPNKYFDSKARRVPIETEEILNDIEKKKIGNDNIRKISFFYDGDQIIEDITKDYKNNNDDEKYIDENNNLKNSEDKKIKEFPFLIKLKLIFSEPLFIFCVLTLSYLYFIVTCIQYWTSDYMLIALNIQDEAQRLYCFSIVCLTAPTLGLLTGGYIVDKLGGYSKKQALFFCLFFSLLSVIPAVPLPLVNNLYAYGPLLWVMIFFGSALIPSLQGIIIACLPKDVQGSGNSFSIFFLNLLGYFPGPFVYGFLKDFFDDKNDSTKGSRIAQKFIMWSVGMIGVLVGISTMIRTFKSKYYDEIMGRQINKKEEIKNLENNLDNKYIHDEDAIRPRESSLKKT